MEKRLDLQELSELRYQDWLWGVVDAMRKEAMKVEVFRRGKNGCIRLTLVPLCKEEDDWMGGGFYREFRGHMGVVIPDACEREYVFKIHPLGSHTVQYICEDGHTEPVNCYAYSALKTAWRSYVQRKGVAMAEEMKKSGCMTEENGWSSHEGSLCVMIAVDGRDFLRMYCCVSGATSEEDARCATRGVLETQTVFLEYCSDSEVIQKGWIQ